MAWNNIVIVIQGIMNIITSVLTMGWENIVTIVTAVISIIGAIFTGWFEIARTIVETGFAVIVAIFTGKWSEIPIILLVGFETIKSIFFEKLEIIQTTVFNAWEKIKTNIGEHIEAIKKIIVEAWQKVKDNTIGKFGEIVNHIKNVFGIDVVAKVVEVFTNIYNAIVSPLTQVFNWISDKMSSFMSYIPGGGGHNYPPTAEGGIVTSPQVRLVGEAGPEAIIPLSKIGSMGGNQTINISFPNMRVEKEVDINDIVAKIERTFYTNMKRAGTRQ
jgi:hypothetical protein